MRAERSRSRASAAEATALRSRQKKITLSTSEMTRLTESSESSAPTSEKIWRKPTSMMNDDNHIPNTTPSMGMAEKYSTFAT